MRRTQRSAERWRQRSVSISGRQLPSGHTIAAAISSHIEQQGVCDLSEYDFNDGFNARGNVAAAAFGCGIYRDAVSQGCCMNVLTVISPALKVLFERVGKPEVINRPDFSRLGGAGAVIACNHVGWADSLWVTYAVYPRQLRYMSKQELFSPSLSRWVLEHVGSIPIDRADPSPSSIKTVVDILQHGGVILIFPSGTRSDENIVFRRGAATVALHARVPLVPAFFQGPSRTTSTAVQAPSFRQRRAGGDQCCKGGTYPLSHLYGYIHAVNFYGWQRAPPRSRPSRASQGCNPNLPIKASSRRALSSHALPL